MFAFLCLFLYAYICVAMYIYAWLCRSQIVYICICSLMYLRMWEHLCWEKQIILICMWKKIWSTQILFIGCIRLNIFYSRKKKRNNNNFYFYAPCPFRTRAIMAHHNVLTFTALSNVCLFVTLLNHCSASLLQKSGW